MSLFLHAWHWGLYLSQSCWRAKSKPKLRLKYVLLLLQMQILIDSNLYRPLPFTLPRVHNTCWRRNDHHVLWLALLELLLLLHSQVLQALQLAVVHVGLFKLCIFCTCRNLFGCLQSHLGLLLDLVRIAAWASAGRTS